MTNLMQKLKAFEKTARFKELVAEKMKTDPNFGVKGNSFKDVAVSYGDAMRDILRNEILNVESVVAREILLDCIIVEENFISGVGWTVDVSFDEIKTHRESLYPEGYPDGTYLDKIFNDGYPKIRADVWGKWHGEYTYGLDHREGSYFIQKAVEKFNTKYKGKATAQYSDRFAGGTL